MKQHVLDIVFQPISYFLRFLGNFFLKASYFPVLFHRSKLVQRGTERSLYRTKFGDYFWLKKSNHLDSAIIKYGVFEEPSTTIVKKFVKQGDVVFDVGANIGYYSVILSKLVGSKGRVFAFEPTQYFGRTLKVNLDANEIQNVEVINFGLSNAPQTLEIQIGEVSATLHSPGREVLKIQEKINLTTLDRFVRDRSIPKIDFIKIDIDGHEPLFFDGAWNALDQFDPLILLEVSHAHYFEAGVAAWDFYDRLKSKNYRIYYEDTLKECLSKVDFLARCGNFTYSANILISRRSLL